MHGLAYSEYIWIRASRFFPLPQGLYRTSTFRLHKTHLDEQRFGVALCSSTLQYLHVFLSFQQEMPSHSHATSEHIQQELWPAAPKAFNGEADQKIASYPLFSLSTCFLYPSLLPAFYHGFVPLFDDQIAFNILLLSYAFDFCGRQRDHSSSATRLRCIRFSFPLHDTRLRHMGSGDVIDNRGAPVLPLRLPDLRRETPTKHLFLFAETQLANLHFPSRYFSSFYQAGGILSFFFPPSRRDSDSLVCLFLFIDFVSPFFHVRSIGWSNGLFFLHSPFCSSSRALSPITL